MWKIRSFNLIDQLTKSEQLSLVMSNNSWMCNSDFIVLIILLCQHHTRIFMWIATFRLKSLNNLTSEITELLYTILYKDTHLAKAFSFKQSGSSVFETPQTEILKILLGFPKCVSTYENSHQSVTHFLNRGISHLYTRKLELKKLYTLLWRKMT